MFKKITSIILSVAFIAMASSGMLMLLNKGFSFQLKMHPVHNIFGIIMILAGLIHAILNFRSIKLYLKKKTMLAFGIVLVTMLGLLYVGGIKKPLDPEFIEKLEQLDNSYN